MSARTAHRPFFLLVVFFSTHCAADELPRQVTGRRRADSSVRYLVCVVRVCCVPAQLRFSHMAPPADVARGVVNVWTSTPLLCRNWLAGPTRSMQDGPRCSNPTRTHPCFIASRACWSRLVGCPPAQPRLSHAVQPADLARAFVNEHALISHTAVSTCRSPRMHGRALCGTLCVAKGCAARIFE